MRNDSQARVVSVYVGAVGQWGSGAVLRGSWWDVVSR